MNDKQFIETYCNNCGSQRCEGFGTEWFEGCKYRYNHDSYNATQSNVVASGCYVEPKGEPISGVLVAPTDTWTISGYRVEKD